MSESQDLPIIDYYSDALCVWAWISQARLDALREQFSGRVIVRQRFIDVFGDAHEKIKKKWGESEGFNRFGEHVQESTAGFPEITLHEGLWSEVRPRSSLVAHHWIHAVQGAAGAEVAYRFACEVRSAFFSRGQDISQEEVLSEIASAMDLPLDAMTEQLISGEALASVAADQKAANAFGLRGSPTWIMNDGRQLLYGNVGYRILEANVEALLNREQPGASWC